MKVTWLALFTLTCIDTVLTTTAAATESTRKDDYNKITFDVFERNGLVTEGYRIPGIRSDNLDYTENDGSQQLTTKNSTSLRTVSHRKSRWKKNIKAFPKAPSNRRKRSIVPSSIMITQHFNAKIVSPGEDVSLHCTASSDRPPRFIWERDGVVISSNTDTRYILGQMMSSSLGVTSQLNLTRVRVEDGGVYSCIGVEGDSSVPHSARIDVFGPPYIRTLPPIKIQSGDSLNLRCPYYGYPISKLEWEHKGKKLASSNLPHISRYRRSMDRYKVKRQIFPGNDDGVLHIPKLTKEDSGSTYTCVVFSPSGEMARRSFEVQVVEAPILDELRMGTGLKEGQIVQITCNIISGDPPIYFSWLKDGKKIPTNLKITERSSELFSVLIIKKVSLEHCGKYTCIAANHVGKVNQTSDLYINVAPKWLEEPTNTSLLLGQRGAVHCNANGFPQPQIHWMKRDAGLGIWRPVLDLAGGGILSYPNGTLVIEVVSLSDEGLYACNVENGVGEPLGKNLWINVNKPVHFESVGTNVTTKKGLPINMSCQPLGDNPIRIKWNLDGKPIDFTSSRVAISEAPSSSGLVSSLHIVYADSRDAGVYECRASNPYGVASFNVYLQVLEPPVPPAEIQVSSVSSNLARISWRDPSKSPHYVIQYSAQRIFTVNYTRQNDEITQTLELHNLQPATDYQLRIASGNQVDLSAFSMPLHFTTQQEAPSSPPLSVQVQPTENPGELQLNWLPPPVDTHNGMLQGYLVKALPRLVGEIVPTETLTKTIKVLSRSGKQGTVLSGLLKNTRYAISISAFNSAGSGPFSLPVYQTTREGAPELAPSSVECIGVSSTSLRVSWQPIPYTGLLGYSVFYANDDGFWQNTSSSHTEIYLQNLHKYSNYTVKLAGVSNYGMGPFSYPVLCTTLQDVPGPPAAIKALMASQSSILVSWKPPDLPNGQITHYTVYCKLMSGSSPPLTYRIEPTDNKQLTFLINNLQYSKQYEIRVTAHTSAGEGSSSERLHVTLHARSGPKHNHDEGKVVAGIASLSGSISVGVGSSLLLVCQCVGNPPPRTVWYHNHNIITHHPRFTRNHDDSLLINNIDQSLSGNYTCLAKNIYGSDSVSYEVSVLPTPEPPNLRVISHKYSMHLNWNVPRNVANKNKIEYNLSWKEATGPWQDTYSNKGTILQGIQEYTLEELKCGTKYSLRITASNSVGSSQPAYMDASTLGGVPIPPTSTEWFWSNSTHIYIQLSGWDDNGCDITRWHIDYRQYGAKMWKRADNSMSSDTYFTSFTISGLTPSTWYQIRVTAENSAGTITSIYGYATTNEKGERIGPPSEFFDINMVVIICSSILLLICSVTCVYILVKRHNHRRLTEEYRNSLTADIKSERSNITVNTAQSQDARLYSAPVHMPDGKHELYEISPYAQFAIGFRTFGHVENQEAPRHLPNSDSRYHTETSFQVRSESEDSDCVSRSTTLKSVPRKACRIPHHR